MPRPKPLKLMKIPKIDRRQVLPQKHDYATKLGHPKLPNNIADELAHCIMSARATPSLVAGLTLRRMAAELERYSKKLRRGRDMKVRQKLANPAFGFDIETFLRLQPLVAAPTAVLLAAIEVRRREIEQELRLPQADPQRQALESAGSIATWFFMAYATDDVRNEAAIWWDFVLCFLDDADFPTEMLRRNPETLRPLLARFKSQSENLVARLKPDIQLLMTPGPEQPR